LKVANEVKSPEEIRLLLHRKQAIIDVRFRRDVRRPVVFGGSVALLLMWKPATTLSEFQILLRKDVT
jgi:hypothetical protein